jgi:hypothetical protein
MQSTEMIVPAFSNDFVIFYEDTAYNWIWTDLAPATFSNSKGSVHEFDIRF